VFFEDAGVHHYRDACAPGCFRSLVMDYTFLHPDGAGFDADR
jgi:hypothetical protein